MLLLKIRWFLSVTDPAEIASRDYGAELQFVTSRSSGPGGQNVNKLETRVTLRFHVSGSQVLTEEERNHLLKKWAKKLTNEGYFLIHSEQHRSQLKNKEECIKRFRVVLEKAFTKPKKRKASKPSKAAIKKRIDDKKLLGRKKSLRKPPRMD